MCFNSVGNVGMLALAMVGRPWCQLVLALDSYSCPALDFFQGWYRERQLWDRKVIIPNSGLTHPIVVICAQPRELMFRANTLELGINLHFQTAREQLFEHFAHRSELPALRVWMYVRQPLM